MRVRPLTAAFAISATIVLSATAVAGPDTMVYRSDFVSARPFIEFRARNSGVTHAFVVTGYEYDNGLLVYNGGGGFYPKDGKMLALRVVQGTPGEVKLKDVDFRYNSSFRVHVTPVQLQVVNNMIANWAVDKDYKLIEQNCAHFIRDVADAIGLKTHPIGIPLPMVRDLRQNNQLNTPLKQERLSLPQRYLETERRQAAERSTLARIPARREDPRNPRPDLRANQGVPTDSYTNPGLSAVQPSSPGVGVGVTISQGGGVVVLPKLGSGPGGVPSPGSGILSTSAWGGVLPTVLMYMEVGR